ncbi:hypothetical protein [Nostoc sp. DSM 114161]|uniref:hypothetical protein n=1 Tax=Nostoc sp. DSM 114161 TaxID=3440143 RepID=UPI0040454D93
MAKMLLLVIVLDKKSCQLKRNGRLETARQLLTCGFRVSGTSWQSRRQSPQVGKPAPI